MGLYALPRRVAFIVFFLLASYVLLTPAYAQRSLTLRSDGESVNIRADRIEQIGANGVLIAEGNVEITQGTSRLEADRFEVNLETGEGVALGRANFFDGQDRLTGERIDYNFKTGTGVVHSGRVFSPPAYRLGGERLERLGDQRYRVSRGVFTTCEQEVPHWSFRMESAEADLESFVWGRNASFWVWKLPVIPWIPFFAAPVRRERQTGLLVPSVGHSSTKGASAELPFFWAINDSQDLTLVLNPIEKRGVGFGAEYRYIFSQDTLGQLGGFFIRETEKDGDDRFVVGWRHDQRLTDRLSLKIDVNHVSDDDYFSEYTDRLGDRGRQRLDSNLFLAQRWDSWLAVGNFFWFQDLTTPKPTELHRLPEIRMTGIRQPVPGLPSLYYEVDTSFTNFVRNLGSDGRRLDIHPRVSMPIRPEGVLTFTPFVGGRTTLYDQKVVGTRTERGVTFEDTESTLRGRNLVEAGADVETRLTRVYPVGGPEVEAVLHAIEPRVNYTYIPHVKQNDLPQWDPNIDTIAHTSKLTYSLINRLMAKSRVTQADQEAVRWELLRLVVSQTYDFLPNAEEPWGDVFAEVILQTQRWLSFRADAAYNVHGEGLVSAHSDVAVTLSRLTAAVGSRFSRPPGETEIHSVYGSAVAKVHRFIDLRASTEYDVKNGQPVEHRLGIDFFQQCWGVSLDVVERHRSEDIVKVSVDLLGLGSSGNRRR